ncbi:hypothetical protein IE81DRAFT_350370 [Ceraceosorus guamensis]|uniref:Mediator of RNA polymerase II transcription subunit 21 n=1 Tax=Ceraceosorus guamensis TaxID=1522189 RepID=A0A316VPK3_9BASI|nr:hypothetical protein IE81DRAFT_350370 [Ceraceosorus guamensis]PWN39214.1 hypothetical protein IE81DRAFT_350370 [Ceraceosorus guamensis]
MSADDEVQARAAEGQESQAGQRQNAPLPAPAPAPANAGPPASASASTSTQTPPPPPPAAASTQDPLTTLERTLALMLKIATASISYIPGHSLPVEVDARIAVSAAPHHVGEHRVGPQAMSESVDELQEDLVEAAQRFKECLQSHAMQQLVAGGGSGGGSGGGAIEDDEEEADKARDGQQLGELDAEMRLANEEFARVTLAADKQLQQQKRLLEDLSRQHAAARAELARQAA